MSEYPVVLREIPPGFELRRAKEAEVPDGVEYAGIVRTPDGQHYGVHARVVELEDGHKAFVGGLFPMEAV